MKLNGSEFKGRQLRVVHKRVNHLAFSTSREEKVAEEAAVVDVEAVVADIDAARIV